MDADDLIKEAKEARNIMAMSKEAAEKFAESVRDVAIDFIKNESREVVKINEFKIKYRHPWFLHHKKYGMELEIIRKDECILSWIQVSEKDYYGWSNLKWQLNDLEMKEVSDLRDFIAELQKHMSLDLVAMFALNN